MQFVRLPHFKRLWKKLPQSIQEKAGKTFHLLAEDRTHPSLRLKRFQRNPEFWEVRIDKEHRLLCKIEDEKIILVAIGSHEILDRFN